MCPALLVGLIAGEEQEVSEGYDEMGNGKHARTAPCIVKWLEEYAVNYKSQHMVCPLPQTIP